MSAVVVLLVVLMALVLTSTLSSPAKPLTSWLEFKNYYASDSTMRDRIVEVRDSGIRAVTERFPGQEGKPVVVELAISPGDREFYLKEVNELTGGRFKQVPTGVWQSVLISLLPFVIIILIIWFFISRMLRSAGGAGPGGMLGSFGKSRHRMFTKENTGVTFADVAGIDEAKDEVTEIIEFLKNPKRFMKLGGASPAACCSSASPVAARRAAGQGHRRRGRGPVLLDLRLRLCRDVRRRRRPARARPLQAGQGIRALHHLP